MQLFYLKLILFNILYNVLCKISYYIYVMPDINNRLLNMPYILLFVIHCIVYIFYLLLKFCEL